MSFEGWTDDELLRYEFRIEGRPDLDETLSRAKPPEGAKLRFLRDYNITPPTDLPHRREVQPYVWCALCQEPTHWIGWEAETVEAPGVRFLVGQRCAANNGGPEIRRAANAYRANVRRADALKTRFRVEPILARVESELVAWMTSPEVEALAHWRNDLRKLAPDAYRELEQAARRQPPALQVEYRVRDHAREAARDQRVGSDRDAPHLYRTDWKTVAVLDAPALYAGPTLRERIKNLHADLRTASGKLEARGSTTREMEMALKGLREVETQTRAFERAYGNVAAALSAEAIDKLAEWMNGLVAGTYRPSKLRRAGRRLVKIDDNGRPTTVDIPTVAQIRRPAALDELHLALGGNEMALVPEGGKRGGSGGLELWD